MNLKAVSVPQHLAELLRWIVPVMLRECVHRSSFKETRLFIQLTKKQRKLNTEML